MHLVDDESKRRARTPAVNSKPIKAATPIHFAEYHQCPRPFWCELAAFVFRGFLVCSRLMGKSEKPTGSFLYIFNVRGRARVYDLSLFYNALVVV